MICRKLVRDNHGRLTACGSDAIQGTSPLRCAAHAVFSLTVLDRPTLDEASFEAITGPDTHWTSQVSIIGMTRISRELFEATGR